MQTRNVYYFQKVGLSTYAKISQILVLRNTMYFMPLYLPKEPSERKNVPGLIDICDISTNVYVSEWNENIREVRKIVKNERSYN